MSLTGSSPRPLASGSGVSSLREITPCRQQKWLEQLCQVESRLLANWQEFAEHRQEVQLRLQDMHESVQRLASAEVNARRGSQTASSRLEGELERYQRRVTQLGESQEEMAGRFGELRTGVESGREAVDALRTRVAERLQEMGSAIEEHQREVSTMNETCLREALDTAKRSSRTVAEELLRKMEDLNSKFRENMANVEEQNGYNCQRLQQEIKELADRTAAASDTTEAALRSRVSELQAQLHEVSDQFARLARDSSTEAVRLQKIEGRLQQQAVQLEGLHAAVKQHAQRADAGKAELEELRASNAEQVGRLREDVTGQLNDQQKTIRESLEMQQVTQQDRTRQQRQELLASLQEANARADSNAERLRESLRSQEVEITQQVAALQASVGGLEQRGEQRAEQVATLRASVESAQDEMKQAQQAIKSEFTDQVKQVVIQFEEQLDVCMKELRLQAEAVRVEATDTRCKLQSGLAEQAEQLGQFRRSMAENAQGVTAAETEWRRRIDGAEQGVRQLRESTEQRARAAIQSVAELREELTHALHTKVEQAGRATQQIYETQAISLEELKRIFEASLTALTSRVEASAEETQRLVDEAKFKSHSSMEEHVQAVASQLRERIEAFASEQLKAHEAVRGETTRRCEAVERLHSETASRSREKLRELQQQIQERYDEAFRTFAEDQRGRSDRLTASVADFGERIGRVAADVQESRGEMSRDLEVARRTSQQQLEELTVRLEARIDVASSTSASSWSKALAEAHTQIIAEAFEKADQATCLKLQAFTTRDHAEKISTDLKELLCRAQSALEVSLKEFRTAQQAAMESQGRELKHVKETLQSTKEALTAAKCEAKDHEAFLAAKLAAASQEAKETCVALEERLRQQKDAIYERLAEARTAAEEHLKWQQSTTLEQLQEVKAQMVEKHKQQAIAHTAALDQVRAALIDQLKAHSAGAEERAAERAMDTQRKAEERFHKAVQAVGQDVADLQSVSKALVERFKGHQDHTAEHVQKQIDTQHKMEERFAKMVRDLGAELAEVQNSSRSQADRLQAAQKQHEEVVSKVQQEQWGSFSEQHTRQLAQLAEHLTEARDTLTEQVKLAREAATEQVRQAKDTSNELWNRLRVKIDEQQRDTESALRAVEMGGVEAARVADAQLQEARQANQNRSAEIEARLEALRHELEQQVVNNSNYSKRQAEEFGALAVKSQALEQRLTQERERLEAVMETQAKQLERQLEVTTERLTSTLSDTEASLKRGLDTCWATSTDVAEQLRTRCRESEVDAKAREEQLNGRLGQFQARLSELKAECCAAAAAAQQREDHISAELDRVARAGREDLERAESRIQETSAVAARYVEALEQRLQAQIEATASTMAPKEKLAEARVETQRFATQADDNRRASEARAAELTARLEKTDERLKEQVQSVLEDSDRRSKRNAEALEALKRQTAEQVEVIRKRCAEMQQGLEAAIQQKSSESLAQAKAASLESHQRLQRDTAEAASELRQRIDEAVEKQLQELRDLQTTFHGKLHESQTELQRQLAADRQATQTLVAESGRAQEERAREAVVASERERSRSETQVARQFEELQRGLRREFTEATQRVEASAANELERESERALQALEEVRRSSASAMQSMAENLDRRLREASETATRVSSENAEQQRTSSEELRALLQHRSQSLDDRISELRDHLGVLERDLRQTAVEELPALARKVAGGQQAQAAALDELKRVSLERHTQTTRKVQGEAEALALMAQQVTTIQDESRSKTKELEQQMFANVAIARKEARDELTVTRDELHTATKVDIAALQSSHAELTQAIRVQKDRQGGALAEASRHHDERADTLKRRLDEVEALTSATRILAICGESVDGIVRSVTSQELQSFQREALDSLEWKLERCVQWLHGANVKLGLNPQGTLFSTDRFREMLFDEVTQQKPPAAIVAAGPAPSPGRAQRRSHSAKAQCARHRCRDGGL